MLQLSRNQYVCTPVIQQQKQERGVLRNVLQSVTPSAMGPEGSIRGWRRKDEVSEMRCSKHIWRSYGDVLIMLCCPDPHPSP